MAESSDSVSIDIDMVPLGEKVKQPPHPKKKKKMKNPPRKFYFLYLFLFYSNARLHFYFFLLSCSTCCFFVVFAEFLVVCVNFFGYLIVFFVLFCFVCLMRFCRNMWWRQAKAQSLCLCVGIKKSLLW